MTPAAISEIEKAYIDRIKDKREHDEQMAWLNGQYVRAAIISAFDKKVKYPKNPIEEKELKRTDFTDDEKEKYVNMLFGNLEEMQNAFEANQKKQIKTIDNTSDKK